MQENRDAYIATIYLLQFSVSLLAGCVIVCTGGQICLYLGTAEARRLMIYAAILPFLQNILSMTQVLMLSVGKAKALAVRNLVISLLSLLIVILTIVFVGSVGIILFMTCILDVAQIIVFFFVLKKSGCIVHLRKASVQLLRPIIHYCLPMAVYTALNTINRDCDKYIIAAMTNTETLAVYTNTSKKLPFDLITSSFITVLLPQITRLISNKEKQETVKVYRAFLEFSYSTTDHFSVWCHSSGTTIDESSLYCKISERHQYLCSLYSCGYHAVYKYYLDPERLRKDKKR